MRIATGRLAHAHLLYIKVIPLCNDSLSKENCVSPQKSPGKEWDPNSEIRFWNLHISSKILLRKSTTVPLSSRAPVDRRAGYDKEYIRKAVAMPRIVRALRLNVAVLLPMPVKGGAGTGAAAGGMT